MRDSRKQCCWVDCTESPGESLALPVIALVALTRSPDEASVPVAKARIRRARGGVLGLRGVCNGGAHGGGGGCHGRRLIMIWSWPGQTSQRTRMRTRASNMPFDRW